MDTFRNMKVFVEVAEAGSFTAAANQLDTTTGYVSRSVSELEAHLRTRLLNRTTRRLALTEAGERYLNRCQAILASVMEAEAEASDAHAKPVGTLKVHAMSSIGQNYVVPAIAAYQERYPAVTIDLTLSQNVPDLIEEGYDVALRLSPDALPDSNYISHKLGTFYRVLCAAPAYLEMYGTPASVDDLSDHNCLQVAMPIFPSERWLLIGPDGEREFQLQNARFKVNVPDAMAAALHEGMGIGALPTLTIRSAVKSKKVDYTLSPMEPTSPGDREARRIDIESEQRRCWQCRLANHINAMCRTQRGREPTRPRCAQSGRSAAPSLARSGVSYP